MRIGIVGAGHMGSALACRWVRAGHNVSLSFNRDPALLAALAESLGPNAAVATPSDAVKTADVVLLSVPFDALDDAVAAIGTAHEAKPLITTVSPYAADFTGETVNLLSRIGTHSAAEEIAARLPSLHVVEAFNLTFADLLARHPQPFGNKRPTVPLCGDDTAAKALVSGLVDDAGLVPLDVGCLRVARVLEPMATAWVQLAVGSGLFPLAGLSLLHEALAPSSILPLDQGTQT